MSWLNRAFEMPKPRVEAKDEIWEMDTSTGILPVHLSYSARAKRITLRMLQGKNAVMLVIPPGCDQASAFEFARSHEGWIRRQLARCEASIPFADGALLPLRGAAHLIVHKDQLRGTIRAIAQPDEEPPVLEVPSPPEHLPRRLTDWLRAQARHDLDRAVRLHGETLNVRPARIYIKDQKSRWGSCSSKGNLNFSWRLVLAPPAVLEYVAAHEVAHLIEMNHSPRFWRLVQKAMPQMEQPRSWLKKNGTRLHRYGR